MSKIGVCNGDGDLTDMRIESSTSKRPTQYVHSHFTFAAVLTWGRYRF